MTSEFFGPLPPSDFNRDAMQRWLDQQVVSFQKIITGSLQADNVLSSSNYVAGVSGWMIDGDGNAEFNDVEVRGDIISGNWDGTIPVDLSSYDVGATAGFALDSSEGTAQFMGDVFVGGDLRLRGSTARFGTGPTGGPRIDMVAGQSADGADNALFTIFYLTNIADPTINNKHPGIAAFVSGRGTPGETNSLNLRSGAYGSDGPGHITITSRSLDGSSNPTALVRIGGPGGPTRFAASDAAYFYYRTFFSDGSASQPAIAFQSDTDTGIYRVGDDRLGIAVGGANRIQFADDPHMEIGFGGAGGVGIRFWEDNIGAGRTYRMEQTPTFGGFRFVGVTAAGTETVSYEIYDDGQFRVQQGSSSKPGLTFIGDTDTGIYRPTADTVSIVTGGATRAAFALGDGVFYGPGGATAANEVFRWDGSTKTIRLHDGFPDIGNHEVLRANRGTGTQTTVIGYFSSWEFDPDTGERRKDDIVSLAESPRWNRDWFYKIRPIDFRRLSTGEREFGFLLDEWKATADDMKYLTTKGDQWGSGPHETAILAATILEVQDHEARLRALEQRLAA